MCHDCILVTNICVPYTHINTLHLTNNNNTAFRPCKGHRCDHFFGAPCAPLEIGASGARSQRRRPKFWGLSCKCDLQLDPDLVRTCCLLTARDDAVLCSTPCFCSCSAVLLFVPISASRLSARECESKSVARSPARSRNAQPAMLRKSLLWFLLKTFVFLPSYRAAGFRNWGVGAVGQGGAFAVLGLAAKAARCRCR